MRHVLEMNRFARQSTVRRGHALGRALATFSTALAVASIAFGCGGSNRAPEKPPRLVQAFEAATGTLSVKVRAWGTTRPKRRVELAFQVQGEVEEISFDEGDVASRGDVLARLRRERFAANVASARAALKEAERNLDRARRLAAEGVLSDEERERAETALAAAKAMYESAVEDLRGAAVVAPFDGIVTKRYCELGQVVVPGVPAFVFMQLDPMLVGVTASDVDVASLREGQEATVTVDAFPGKTFAGRVSKVSPAAEEPGGSFEVEIEIPNPDLGLKAGMAAEVEVTTRTIRERVLLPVEAVLHRDGEARVFVVEDGVAVARPVEVQAQAESLVAVTGISPGDTVVAAGNRFLREGERVRVVMLGSASRSP